MEIASPPGKHVENSQDIDWLKFPWKDRDTGQVEGRLVRSVS